MASVKTQYAVKVGDLSWVQISSGPSAARPEATRAPMGRIASIKNRKRVRHVNYLPIFDSPGKSSHVGSC
jgi:hypothetical protein